jgi:hypothetical protein
MPPALAQSPPAETPSPVEEVYLFRSLFEKITTSETEFCRREAPFTATVENAYSLWSVESDAASGRVIAARRQRIGDLRACVGVHPDGRVRLYALGTINGIAFRGEGDQYASQQTDTVNSRVNRFLLERLPPPYVAGLLSSNTVRTTPPDAPGYLQSSVGVIRLWRRP